jgi:hypothetical protein
MEHTEEIREITVAIESIICDMPITSWSETVIHDTIQQWVIEHGRNPTSKDMKYKGLPPVPVITNRFKMSVKDFLNTYYPQNKKIEGSIHGEKSREEWVQFFQTEYKRILPAGAQEYNLLRTPNTPTWKTIAGYADVSTWLELLEYCKLALPVRREPTPKPRIARQFTVTHEMDINIE